MTASSASASASTAAGSTSLDGDVVGSSLAPVAVQTTSSESQVLATVATTDAPRAIAITTPAPVPSIRAPAPSPQAGGGDNTSNKSPQGISDCKSGSKETAEELLERRRTTGTCSFYPSKFKECAEPRSCYDCLNFAVQGEDGGCMLSEYGRCVPARMEYNSTLDYTHYRPANANSSSTNSTTSGAKTKYAGSGAIDAGDVGSPVTQRPSQAVETWYHFRAGATRYCEKTDAACKECRRSVFADFIENETKRGGNAFCIGTGGCVCIATCEARRDRPAPNKDCYAKALAANKKESKAAVGDGGMGSVFAILGAMMFVVVTVFALYRMRSQSERRRSSASGPSGANASAGQTNVVATPDAGASPSNSTVMVTVTSTTARASGSRLLNLFGWHAIRDDLADKEHAQLVDGDASALKHSSVQFVGIEPSAPEIDTAVPSAPMAAMAIPVVPMAVLASAPMVFSVRATASAPDFEDMDDFDVL